MPPVVEATSPLWPLLFYVVVVVVVIAGQIILSYFLGQRHSDRQTAIPYESGIESQGSARLRFTATFYLVAMLFVVFDLESVFLFCWAIAFRDLGWSGYLKMLVFVIILVLSLIYLWRIGALEAGPPKHKRSSQKQPG